MTLQSDLYARNAREAAFTLIETAIVLVILGLVVMTVLPALEVAQTSGQRQVTQSNLHSLMLATAAYTQANGCLPCPTPLTSGIAFTAAFGQVGTQPAACGICANPEGIPPFASLGIPASVAHDGWGHWITMRVDSGLTVLPTATGSVFIPPTAPCVTNPDVANGICTSDEAVRGARVKGLCRAASHIANANPITVKYWNGQSNQPAAVIFISHGVHGYGAYLTGKAGFITSYQRISFPASYPSCSNTTGFAKCNADGDSIFVDGQQQGGNDPYDDVLLYANRNALLSQFGTGSCDTNYP